MRLFVRVGLVALLAAVVAWAAASAWSEIGRLAMERSIESALASSAPGTVVEPDRLASTPWSDAYVFVAFLPVEDINAVLGYDAFWNPFVAGHDDGQQLLVFLDSGRVVGHANLEPEMLTFDPALFTELDGTVFRFTPQDGPFVTEPHSNGQGVVLARD